MCCSILGQQNVEEILSSFVSLILLELCMSGEKSREMHVHIGGEENENILDCIEIKHVSV